MRELREIMLCVSPDKAGGFTIFRGRHAAPKTTGAAVIRVRDSRVVASPARRCHMIGEAFLRLPSRKGMAHGSGSVAVRSSASL
jgi:hypothetical protein